MEEYQEEYSDAAAEQSFDPEENTESQGINPFNPEDISLETKALAMDGLIRRLMQGSLILNPGFQRHEVWQRDKKSQLIESLMLSIPLPMFYLSSDEDGVLTVVDGLQRLSTIRDFVLGEKYMSTLKDGGMINDAIRGRGFKLKYLEFWSAYEGKQFADLPPKLQNRILETQIQVTIIKPSTPEDVKRNIFKRINTGGVKLNSQEIRNALYEGTATELLNEMSSLQSFKDATENSVSSLRMEDRELILRFVSFLIRKYEDYNKTVPSDLWLADTMIILNAMPDISQEAYRRLSFAKTKEKVDFINISKDDIIAYFDKAMKRSVELFGSHAFRKSYDDQKKSRINRCLFEMWANILGGLSDEEYGCLKENKSQFMQDYSYCLDDNDFMLAISRDSMKHLSVKYRFNKLKELTQKYTKNNAN